MIGIAKVVGSSMLPTFSHGDFVITARPLFRNYRCNDLVAVNHPRFGRIIKRISHCFYDGTFQLVGDNHSASATTEAMGIISSEQILGRVIWTIRQN